MNVVEILVKARDTGAKATLAGLGDAFKGLGVIAAGAIGVGVATPLVAAGLALGGFAAVAIPTLSKVKTALSATGTAGKKAYDQLDPAQRDLFHNVRDLQHQFDGLAKSMEPLVLTVANMALRVGSALLPAIKSLAGAGAEVLTGFFTPLLGLLHSDFFGAFIKQMTQLAATVAPQLGQSLVALLRAFMRLFMEVGPKGADLLKGLLKLLVLWVQNLVPFIVWVVKAADATGKWAGANKLLFGALLLVAAGVAIATGGLSLIIPAILAVIAWITYMWKHSETFRSVVTQAFSDVADAVLRAAHIMAVGMKFIADQLLNVGITALQVAASIPGPWQNAAKKSLAALEHFKSGVDQTFNAAIGKIDGWRHSVDTLPTVVKLKADISNLQSNLNSAERQLANPNLTKTRRARLEAETAAAMQRIAALRVALDSLQNKTIYVTTIAVGGGTYLRASGGLVGAATGGLRSNLTMVGEHGRELVSLPPGSMVHSNPDTERMIAQGGGSSGGGRVVLEIRAGDNSPLTQALMWAMQHAVRVGGGDPAMFQRKVAFQ